MSLLVILHSLSNWAPVVFVRDSKYGMPAVQSVHLVGLTMFLATILVLNLRLSGAGLKDFSLSCLARRLKAWMILGVSTVILSGMFIFLATPDKYLGSYAFRVKMALLVTAILFHLVVLRRFLGSDPVSRPRAVNVMVAMLSVTLWFGVGWAGRAIAFVP
jgi:hypothetical protein